MKSTQPSGWLSPVQRKGKLWARGASVEPEVSYHSALKILVHLASWYPAAFWRWKVSGQRNRDNIFGVVHIRCWGLKSQQSCLSTDHARGKPICAPSIQFLSLHDYNLLSQLSYFSARWQPSASGASSNSGAVRSFSDLRSELTLHAPATELSRKPDVGCLWKYLCLWESGTSSGTDWFFAKFSFSSCLCSQYKVHILHELIGSF